ncbi:MAG TPA: IPT/TIG domain-containing protein [Alphaproteobacteria bacterium]|nr:IPT/TIG domain-containing protein [Alphaproteobacteria bacterium]
MTNGFTVNAPAPAVTSLSPASAIQGATTSVTITGTAFQSGATCNFGAGITVNSCAFVSATQLTAGITVAAAATTGPRTVTVTNPDTQVGSLTNGFTVTLPPPTVTSLNPNSAIQGATTSVTITGTAFQSGATCSFGAGITVNSCAFVSATQLTAGITIASAATTGTRTVTVTNPDTQVGSLTNGFTVNAPPPPPTVTSLNPAAAIQGATTSVTITGTAFQSGATCSFGAGITVNSCAFVSATQLTAGITVSATAATGTRTVTVTNPDAQVGSLVNGFTVNVPPPPPTLTSLNPVSGIQGATVSVTITGTAFQSGATCNFGAGITVNSCAFVSATQLTAGITIASAAATGPRTVTVTNPDTQAGSLTNGFTVNAPAPAVTSLNPASAIQGATTSVTITGTAFQSGATCSFGAGITVNSCAFVSATQLTAGITVASGAATGTRTVTVTNPDAQVGSLTNGFTVTAPPPTVTSVNPVSAIQGSTTSVTITGTAFQSGATCSFGAAITVNSCAFVSATQLTAGITVASGATTGARTVTVTNPDTQVGSLTNGFTVTAPAPTVTGLNPVSANQGLTTSVTITGTAFQSGATCSFGAGITVNSCAFVSSTQMTAGITVAASATAGTRTVTVTNPDTQVGSLTNGFTVTVPSNPPPTLTSLAPNSGTIGGSAAITLTGTNFLNGATCNFGAGVTVNSCTFVSATQLTANITIPLGTVPGLRSVTVVNPDGQSSTLANSFTLNGPLHFDFTYPDRTSLLNAGWSYIATTAAGGTRDTEQSGALAPSYDQVAHPGTIRIPLGSGELWQSLNDSQNTLFRTLPSNWSSIRLKIASYNPVANYQQVGLLVYQNDDNYVDLNRLFANSQSIELFQESAQNTLSANRLSLANTGNLILRIDRSGSTYTGSYSVDGGANFVTVANTTIALTNPELGIQIGSNAGGPISADLSWVEIVQPAVLPAPGITSVAPSSAAQGVTTNLTITGTNFQSGATCSFGAGVTVNSCAFVSATQLTANVSISAVAAVGPRAVTVTNPDLQSGTTNGAFTVTASAPPPPPSLTSLNPTSGAQATTVNVTLTGTNFLSGATCSFGAGITVNSCTFNSATQLIANVTIAVSATTGTRSVTVTNPDNQTSTLANAFTVTSAPVLNAGNATAVVLINSANTTGFNTNTTNPGEFQRFTQQYLDHLQVPYVTVDVSLVTPPSNLSSRALIIAGHAGLNLSVDWQNAISSAVSAGAGFVNLDYNLNIGTAAHMKAIFGATGAVQGSQASTVSVPAALIPGGATPHFITALQKRFLGDPAGDVVYNFHQNTANVVPTVSATVLQGATGTVIAKLGTDPLILATTFGSGRAVNFGTYLHLQAGGFGFLQGTDDLFWRSLVWAARKPFVLRGYPRYFSVQMDDQLSGWGSRIQDAYNTSFTGTTAADGTGGPWKPTGFVYTANLPPGSAERAGVITDINAGKLAVSPHSVAGAAYGEMYWNGSAGALTDAQWLTNFNNILSWKTGNGGADAIPSFSRVLIGHYWDISNNVADDMWNQGFRYITTVQKPGFQQPNTNINQYNGAERFHDRPFWQFDQPPKLHVDEDQPFFFADDLTVGSRAGLPSHTFYHFTTQYHDWVKYPQRPDFIWPSSTNTMTPAQSVDQLERYTWRFWSSMAPVQLFTHDGGNYALATAADRQTVISQGSTWLNSNGVRHLFMDQLGDYIYARNKSTLTDASVSGTTISLTFTGKAATIDGALIPTQLYIFKQDVEGVPATVPGFTTGLSTTVPVP